MQSLFKQTRTKVHSPSAQRRERERGMLFASRSAAAIQLGTQLLLWIFFFGYDQTGQAVWQAVLMLFAPLAALWLVWKRTDPDLPCARWWRLPLILCLIADACFLLAALSGFIGQLVPHFPPWVAVVFPLLICWFTALCARPRGVKYGSAVLVVPLAALVLIGTIFLRASTRGDRLWPILGDGLLSTAGSAAGGAGAVWGVSLLFLHSPGRKTAVWAAVPWGLAALCALWFGFLNPWAEGDHLSTAEKMMGLARHAHSVILYEMSSVLWMLLIPTALIACLSISGGLISSAFPRLPFWSTLAPAALLACAAVLWLPEKLFFLLQTALPWRFVISLLCGAGLWLNGSRRA